MNKIATVCARDCYDTCSLIATTANGQVTAIAPGGDQPITQGFLCPRGIKDAERVYRNRVLRPHCRNAGKPGRHFRATGWDEALAIAGTRLRQVLDQWGPRAVLFLDYSGNMGLLANSFPQRLWRALGVTFTDNSLCTKSGHAALALHYGSSYGIQPEELPDQKLIVYWGFNPAVSSAHMWSLSLKARREHQAKIVVVDPRRSESAGQADLWLPVKPGGDVALAYGVALYLLDHQLLDTDFIARATSGFAEFAREIKKWTPPLVEQATGLHWSDIARLGSLYGECRPSATMIGIGGQKTVEGAEAVRAASLLPALTGHERGFFYANSGGYAVDEPYLNGASQAQQPPYITSQFGLSEPIAQGQFKFIYVHCMNPALTLPNLHAFHRGMQRDDVFLLLHDVHWTETAEWADVVLPAQSYLEKEDVVLPWVHWYLRKSNRVIEPVEESRHEIDVMRGLAREIGFSRPWLDEDPWQALEKALQPALAPGDFARMLAGASVRLINKDRGLFQTPSGKIEFCSQKARELSLSSCPEYRPLELTANEFVLLNSSMNKYTNTQFQDIYGPLPALVQIHPQDAQRLGIAEGQTVTLYNDLGETTVRVAITTAVSPGLLWSPKVASGLNGSPQNILTPGTPQRVGSGAIYNSIRVRIK